MNPTELTNRFAMSGEQVNVGGVVIPKGEASRPPVGILTNDDIADMAANGGKSKGLQEQPFKTVL